MPPKTPGSRPGSKPAAAAPGADELAPRLEEAQAKLGLSKDKLQRLASTQAVLDGQRTSLSTQLTAERNQFDDISSYLRIALAEQTTRSEGLERELAEARAALAATHQAAAEAAAAAERWRADDVGEKQALLDSQAQQAQQAAAFLAERDELRACMVAAAAGLEDEKRQHTKRIMDLERKHASDRELWRCNTAEAVQAARLEMASLTDQRLDATTKQTICDNEAMAGELQYQGRHVQGLLARNTALQKEVTDLRLALGISRHAENELVKKGLAYEKTIESLLARLEEMEEQREAGEQAHADLAEQLAECQAEVHSSGEQLDDQARHIAELEDALEAKKGELRQLRASHSEASSFLLRCLSEVRQVVLGQQGRAALAAASTSTHLEPGSAAGLEAGTSFFAHTNSEAQRDLPQGPVHLEELPAAQREALLQRLLDQLGVDWQEKAGLVLPASSMSSPRAPTHGGLSQSPSARFGGQASLISFHAPSASVSASPSACCLSSSPSEVAGSGMLCGGASSRELMQAVRSDVRPWGTGGLEGGPSSSSVSAPHRKPAAISSTGSGSHVAAGGK